MSFFRKLYEKLLHWSRHRYASYYLAIVSFAESSFFPIPPDVMLVPMVLSRPNKIFYYAVLTTLASVVGGVVGYFLGYFAIELISPLLIQYGYNDTYSQVTKWFSHYGFWAVIFAGFTPFPYKLFTIGSGAMQLSFPLFIIGSIVGRGLRFFMVAYLVGKVGKRFESSMVKYIEMIGWLIIALAIILIVVMLRV